MQQIVIGSVTQPAGVNGAYFREIAVFDASERTERCFRDYGAYSITRDGARMNVTYRGNTGSAVGILDDHIIRQVLHLSGHSQQRDVFPYNTETEIDDLFDSWRPLGG